MTILITGANGQLGRELCELLTQAGKHTVLATDVDTLDITSSRCVENFFETHNHISTIINCAAFTAVDAAEEQRELCRKINVDGPRNLAQAAAGHRARIIHISTDYVFDGKAVTPYCEDDPTAPQGVYGSTKLEGEKMVMQAAGENAVIVRTAWLYSPHGKNFVKTMINLGQSHEALKVVFDQVGTPTYARDLAQAIIDIIEHPTFTPGIFHYSNEGAISWYDFAKAIHHIAGIDHCHVQPCRSCEFPTPAHRPSYSVLDKAKIKRTYGITIPYWQQSLEHCIKRLNIK